MSEFKQDEARKFVFEIRDFDGNKYIAMRLWQREENDWEKTHHGLLIPIRFSGQLKKAIDSIVSEIEEFDEKKE